jgi:hypothetical protein
MSSHDNSKPSTSARQERADRRARYRRALDQFEPNRSISLSNSPRWSNYEQTPDQEGFTNRLIPPKNRGERIDLPLLSGTVVEETNNNNLFFLIENPKREIQHPNSEIESIGEGEGFDISHLFCEGICLSRLPSPRVRNKQTNWSDSETELDVEPMAAPGPGPALGVPAVLPVAIQPGQVND